MWDRVRFAGDVTIRSDLNQNHAIILIEILSKRSIKTIKADKTGELVLN